MESFLRRRHTRVRFIEFLNPVIHGVAGLLVFIVACPCDLIARVDQILFSAIAVPFKGITTDGTTISNLFKLQSARVSTAALRRAADAYLKSLTPAQRMSGVFRVDDDRVWRGWHNTGSLLLDGVGLIDMSNEQRLALNLLRASLSAKGMREATSIMKLNQVYAAMPPKLRRFDRCLLVNGPTGWLLWELPRGMDPGVGR